MDMYDVKEMALPALILCVALCVIVGSNCLGSLADNSSAVKALEIQGFSNVKIVEKDWLFIPFKGGDKTDNVKFTTSATNPAGKTVTVCVYAAWPFKGETIRSC